MSLARRTLHGARITLTAGAVGAVIQIIVIAGLARLISPPDYGLMIAALVPLRPVTHALLSGIERAVVLPTTATAATSWALLRAAAAGGAVLAAVIVAAALAAGFFFRAEAVALVLAATAPTVVFVAVCAVARGVLRRDGRYGRLAALDLAAPAAGGGAAIATAALLDWGAYALVAGQWAQALTQFWLGLRLSGLRPAREPGCALRETLSPLRRSLSKTVLLDLLLGQIPSAMIWGVQGVAALGLYNRMHVLIHWSLESVINPVARVSLDSFSRCREETAQFRRAAIRFLEAAGAVALPPCAGMATAGPELAAVILGPQWTAGGALAPWLCVAAGATVLTQPLIAVAEAGLRLEARARIQLLLVLLTVSALAVALPSGLIQGLVALAGIAGLSFALHLNMAAAALNLPRRALLAPLVPGLTVAIACAGWGMLWSWAASADTPAFWRLAGTVTGCAAISLAVYRLIFPELLARLLGYAGVRPAPA